MPLHRWITTLALVFGIPLSALADLRISRDTTQETVLEISLGRLSQTRVSRQARPYTQIRAEGFEHTAAVGSPEVPHLSARILVPKGSDFQIETFERSPVRHVSLPNPVAFAERLPFHDDKVRLASLDRSAYERTHGDKLVELVEAGYAGNDKILSLRLWPVRYDPAAKSLEITSHFKARVRYSSALSPERPAVAGGQGSLARYLVVNSQIVPRSAPSVKKDLIIAHTSYQSVLFRYLEFKLARGRIVKVQYVSGKTETEIKQIIDTEYQSTEPPTETLLVGNPSQIPAYHGTSDNTWTDYNYQLLGTDSIPDISVGRIPASTPAELQSFLEKAMARETEPRNVGNVLLTAGSDTSLGCPASVTKVGDNLSAAGTDIKVTKKFKTNSSTEEVIAGYNANPNLIVYDGHGNREGMTEIPLTLSSLNKLTNTAFPIILDIACLNANWSSSAGWRNFTTGILMQDGSGAAGIMSSGGSGYGHDFFQTIGKIMAQARKNLASDPKMNEIGQVILAAKILHGPEDRAFWNYYGDPASSVWESPPAETLTP